MLRPIDPLGPREPTDHAELVRRASRVSPIKPRENHEDEAGSNGQHHEAHHDASCDHHVPPEDLDAGTYDDHGRLTEDAPGLHELPAAEIRHIDVSA